MHLSKTNNSSLSLQSSYLIIGKSFLFILNLSHPIILVRVFSQTDFGLYKQLMLLFSTLLPIGQMGITQALYYFVPRENEYKNDIICLTVLLTFLLSLAILLLIIIFKDVISALFNSNGMGNYLHLLGIYCFFMICSSLFEPIMIADNDAKLAAKTMVFFQIIHSSTVSIISLYSKSILFLFYSLICFAIFRFLVQHIYLISKYRLSFRKISYSFLGPLLKYSMPIGFGDICWLMQLKLNGFFVSYYFVAKSYAIYAIGSYNLPIHIITSSIASVMIPSLARLQKLSKKSEIQRIWNNSIRKMNLIITPLIVFAYVFAPELIITLFTNEYIESIILFRISLFSFIIASVNAGAVLRAYAMTNYLMRIGFIRLPVTMLFLFIFNKIWGMIGIMCANVLLTIGFRILLLIKVSTALDIRFSHILEWRKNIKIFFIAIISALPLIPVKNIFGEQLFLCLLICFPLYMVVYYSVSSVLGTIYSYEKISLQQYIKGYFGSAQ